MNKVYKVLFNKSTGKYVVVSEHSKSAKKSSRTAQIVMLAATLASPIAMAGTGLAGGTATGIDAIAVGDRANATGLKSGAIGPEAKASGDDSFAVGTRAQALADYSTALGNQSTAEKAYDLAAGYNAIASGGQSTAVGFGSKSTGTASNAIGGSSLAAGKYSTAVGQEARAEADFTLAAGYKANASGGQSMAVGFGSKSTGNAATAIGSSSVAAGDFSIAIGQESKTAADQNFATALGYKAQANGWASFAQGALATADGNNSISIGDSSSTATEAKDSVAIGSGAKTKAVNAIAIGAGARATGKQSISVGTGNVVSGDNSGAFGDPTTISGTGSYSVGNNNTIATNDTFVVGSNVTKTLDNSVFLGKDAAYTAKGASTDGIGAVTEPVTVGGTVTYGGFAGKTPVGVVSVGDVGKERRIQNMAAGLISATSTDAINGSQLYATNAKLGNVANTVVKNFGGNATLDADGNITYTNIGNTGKDNIHDAIQAATTKVEGDKGVSVTPTTNADGSKTYTVAAKTDNTTVKVDDKGNIAAVTTTFTSSTDGKVGAPVGNGDSLVTAKTVADAINSSGFTLKTSATANGKKLAGGDELINPGDSVEMIAGKNMQVTQEINGKVTYATKDEVEFNKVTVGPVSINNVTGIDAGNTAITNVKAGTGDNDAVNVSQLKAVEATANKGWNLTTNGKAESKSNVKPGDTVDFANEDGNVKIENKGNNVIVNLNKDIDLTKDGSVTIGDTKVNNDGLTIAGGPSVTKSGINAGDKKITNVAPGEISADSKDAINGSQLYTVQQAAVAAKTEVKAGDNVEVKKESGGNGQDIYTVSAKDTSASVTAGSDAITVNKADPKKVVTVDVTDYKVDLSQATKDNIQKGVDAKGIVDNKGLTFAGDNNSSTEVQKLGSTVNVNGDSNITTQASGNTVKVTLNPNVTVESLTATNSVNVGSGNAQVALTTNVGKDDVRELSVGSANAPTRITNVARGVNDTDAVNLSQLKDLGYNINTKIDKVEKEANAGIASAMAMETAPFIAGKWTYAVGAAYHGGEQAVGATLRKTADNGRWSLTGGVATGTEGDPSVRIGISGVID